MAQGISANKQQSFSKTCLLLTVPPVERELPEHWLIIFGESGRKRCKNKMTAAQFKTDLSNPSENMGHDLRIECVQGPPRRANECSRKQGINKKLGCRMKTEP